MDFNKLLKQAQKMQKDMKKTEDELAQKEYTTKAGGDGVQLTINGVYEIIDLKINEDLLEKDNKEMLEELIAIAFNTVSKQATAHREEVMGQLTAGVKMPGMF